ncbi:hypothetical protein NDU88_004114 [Pleurodeles waltl]|uniref:Uncharacterized protein n=1 Tax=Pleurodeles waltl TaxID=8319 RepID=A0AAV7MWB2_PLEWA|nr:hypothetical protein NDU88_004114 [Pleurodeles waltl]
MDASNWVIEALKVLQEEGREDLLQQGMLEQEWVGLKRPKRASSEGVAAAVMACSSPLSSSKKFKQKSVMGRKYTESGGDFALEKCLAGSDSPWRIVGARRGGTRFVRRAGASIRQRVASRGRGAAELCAVAAVGRMGAEARVHAPVSLKKEQRKATVRSDRHSGESRLHCSPGNLPRGEERMDISGIGRRVILEKRSSVGRTMVKDMGVQTGNSAKDQVVPKDANLKVSVSVTSSSKAEPERLALNQGAVRRAGGVLVMKERREDAVRFIMQQIELGLSAVSISGTLSGISFYARRREATGDAAGERYMVAEAEAPVTMKQLLE